MFWVDVIRIENVCNSVIELNSQIEENNREEKSIKELKDILSVFKQNIEFADGEFTAKLNSNLHLNFVGCLDEIDRQYIVETKRGFNPTELKNSINEFLSKIEKEYNFNAIDPIDATRDQQELAEKLKQLEKFREEMGPMLYQENLLTAEEKAKLTDIDNQTDLNAIKELENKILKLLNKGESSIYHKFTLASLLHLYKMEANCRRKIKVNWI